MITQKKFPYDKISVTKSALFSLRQALTHHSFIFNSQFLNEPKHEVRLFKNVRDFPSLIPLRFH